MKKKYKTLPMEGRFFGKWTVIKKIETDKPGCWFECQCECGNIQEIPAVTLRAGRSKQCKECHYESQYDHDKMLGRLFGKWKVISFCDIRNHLQRFNCKCKCGTEKILYGSDLRAEKTKQCVLCHNRSNALKNTKHGMHKTPEYRVWSQMHQRCGNENCSTFKHYGGRGIKVCDRWKKFENFLKDMGIRPIGLTLDRIDNDGDYEPNNCRWVTHKENCNNRKRRATGR